MKEIKIKKSIKEPYYHPFSLEKSGLVAIFISARCKSKKQINSNTDEDLRVEINGLQCREIPPEKYKQFYNIPSAFNGTDLKGLKKTVVFLTILTKGKHFIGLIPRQSAFIEDIKIAKLENSLEIQINTEEQAEDGNTRSWYTFVLIDLPLSKIKTEITLEKRFWDSDDVKIIVDGKAKKNIKRTRYKFWYFIGGVLGWVIWKIKGESKKIDSVFDESLDNGIHYIEFFADRMPILHKVIFSLTYKETNAEKRAGNLVKENSNLIKLAAKEFNVDPILVGSVIYQEQSTNVNFVDALTDYLGGILHLNTSIGIGQVRVNTALKLEVFYPQLKSQHQNEVLSDKVIVTVEKLKDPSINIRYVAAKISFSEERWKKAGYELINKPDILGTLYNIEDIDNPIEPHSNSQTNEFGRGVKNNYKRVKVLLGL